MSDENPTDLGGFSMLELFRVEVENQSAILTKGLLSLERETDVADWLETLMRAAHSLKGAARIVDHELAVQVAHAMEDCFVAAQQQGQALSPQQVDKLLQGVDLLNQLARAPEAASVEGQQDHQLLITAFLSSLTAPEDDRSKVGPPLDGTPSISFQPQQPITTGVDQLLEHLEPDAAVITAEAAKRVLRVAADNLNRMLALAGESLVASRWLARFSMDLSRLNQMEHELDQLLDTLEQSLRGIRLNERVAGQFKEVRRQSTECRGHLFERMTELEVFDRQSISLSNKLYHEVLGLRMRPIADALHGFPRMVRDIARSLNKQVRLEILGGSTPVDRDILELIEAPLAHLVRNAIDHGIEPPSQRLQDGKPAEGTIQIQAHHNTGLLIIKVDDDGQAVLPETLRQTIVEKHLTSASVAEQMSQLELMEFLFLPGFTLRDTVTEISGRGVGLDVVKTAIKSIGGTVRVTSDPGRGMHFQIQLPLTLSVIRALVVEIGGQPYAFPIARISRALKISRQKIESIEGRQHFSFENQQIGLVTAHQVLELEALEAPGDELSVIVLGDGTWRYGLVVDRFQGEHQLVVRTLDPRLGKIKDISAGSLMPDRTPVLIVDVEDITRSIENLVSGGRLVKVERMTQAEKPKKRILVVDDSLTVRELERKLLQGKGYDVEVAVDGMDGWNAVRTGNYDMLITDVDMPRLDGIELVELLKKDPRLHSLPVMIVSYKDRDEDRHRGLEAGADYYLTKGSFHDDTLLLAVADLIGEGEA